MPRNFEYSEYLFCVFEFLGGGGEKSKKSFCRGGS